MDPAGVAPAERAPRRLVAFGDATTCSVTLAKRVVCWGAHMNRKTGCARGPVEIPGLRDVVELRAGRRLCARRESGSIACWSPEMPDRIEELGHGSDAIGDDDSRGSKESLAEIPGYGCTPTAAGLDCWGVHPFHDAPGGVLPLAPNATVVELARGTQHVCARVRSGDGERVVCWGANEEGQLGHNPVCAASEPHVVAGVDDAIAITSGSRHTCVLRRGGRVACFGEDGGLALGGERAADGLWVEPPGIEDATAIAAGRSHTCVVHDGGKVACFGVGSHGQLGDGPSPNAATKKHTYISEYIRSVFPLYEGEEDMALPFADTIGVVSQVRGVSGATQVTASENATCAVTSEGVRCWGMSGMHAALPRVPEEDGDCPAGPLPRPSAQARKLAERVVTIPGTTAARSVGLTNAGGCVAQRSGKVVCWENDKKVRAQESLSGLTDIDSVHTDPFQYCFIDGRGAAHCYSTFGMQPVTPEYADDGSERVFKLATTTDTQTCTLALDGKVACNGGLGQPLADSVSPSRMATVPGIGEAIDISAGEGFSCAVRTTGEVLCWGLAGARVGLDDVPGRSITGMVVPGA